MEKVPVYCHCRLPWDRRDTLHGSLAQCRRFKEWYHEDCAISLRTFLLTNSLCGTTETVLFTYRILF